MSSLPPQAIAEFQALWIKHYGVELPTEQAVLRAGEVFTVLRLVLEKQKVLEKPKQKTESPKDGKGSDFLSPH